MSAKIILLSDVYEMRKRKEEELAFYHDELKKLNFKLDLVRREIDLTNKIIDLIEHDQIYEVKPNLTKD